MHRFVLAILTAMAALGVITCSNSEPKVVRLTQNDAGETVRLSVDDTLQVILEGNPTTGFTWVAGSVTTPTLEQAGEPQFEADTQLIGSGGEFTFRFDAVESGEVALRLIYHRPWESVPPARTFEVTVGVD